MATLCCELPEILEEIFSWLPTQSLMRFKCVSKSWNAFIKSLLKNPEFVNKHLRNIDKKVLSRTTCLVFFCPGSVKWQHPRRGAPRRDLLKVLTVSHDHNESDRINYDGQVLRLPTLFPSELPLAHLFRSHCNGIICLANCYDTVILCNPSINECRTLPEPYLTDGVVGVGFGYDLRPNDYKVVRFGLDNLVVRAEVYSMGADSWREIEIQCQFDYPSHVDKEVFCKGFFYWFIETEEHIIISFDMFHEVFDSIPLPNNVLRTWDDHFIKLAVWNESVALLSCHRETGFTNSIEVWVMDDCHGSVTSSCFWIKKLVIGPLVGIVTPSTFWKNDELLMETANERSISYNLHSQKLRHLTVIEVANTYPQWDFLYMKSLVSVQGQENSGS
ncbi:F-box domain containing protein [Trema orientale]|uniref:F-box domain containing protein n=1 Tax=Trema orientale TaxID=63057 RepID=A0A2P5BEF2_TREOI|nr:F-box domain containing protein [Trema orientale]